ncbi:MAG: preprotein translocase subunit YajC [Nocardioides sp.]|nr:preprotein translocase subunit YajC [Nocardioides sp.]
MQGIEFLPLIAIALLFWLLIIRPQSRRARDLQRLQSSLEVGDRVMLTSGIHGTVTGLDEDSAHVEIAEAVVIQVARGAIGTVAPRTEPTDGPHADGAPGTEGEEKS